MHSQEHTMKMKWNVQRQSGDMFTLAFADLTKAQAKRLMRTFAELEAEQGTPANYFTAIEALQTMIDEVNKQ
jgi:hypothetical protein